MKGNDGLTPESAAVEALREQMLATESGLRELPGISRNTAEKAIKSLRKRHAKMLQKIAMSHGR